MHCADALEHIDLYLSGDLGPLSRLRVKRHVFGCRSCYAELRRARQIHGALDDYGTFLRPDSLTARADLATRVLRAVAEVRPLALPVAAAPPRLRPRARLALAAVLLVSTAAIGVVVWSAMANRRAAEEILARVSAIQGRALYYEPGATEGVPLSVNLFVFSGGRIEVPENAEAHLESNGNGIRYELGPESALELRRGDRGAVVAYERGRLRVEAEEGEALEEVVTPVGSIVPEAEAFAFELGFPPAGAGIGLLVTVNRGRVEARSPEGSLGVGAPDAVLLSPGEKPRRWEAPTATVAARRPAPKPKPVERPAPAPSSAEKANPVSALVRAAVELTEVATSKRPSPWDLVTVSRLIEQYHAARSEVLDRGPAALADLFTAVERSTTSLTQAELGPLAECADAIASRSRSQDRDAVDRAVLEALERPGVFASEVWDYRLDLFRSARVVERLVRDVANANRVDRIPVERASLLVQAILSAPDPPLDPGSEHTLFRAVVEAADRGSADEASLRLARYRILASIPVADSYDPFAKLAYPERDPDLHRRLETYRYLDLPSRDRSRQRSGQLDRIAENPAVIVRQRLDLETVLESLLLETLPPRVELSGAWSVALRPIFCDTKSDLVTNPSRRLRRLAAALCGRFDSASYPFDPCDECAVLEPALFAAALAWDGSLGSIPGAAGGESPSRRADSKLPRLFSHSRTVALSALSPESIRDVEKGKAPKDFLKAWADSPAWVRAAALLEAASTSRSARRWGIWHSLP